MTCTGPEAGDRVFALEFEEFPDTYKPAIARALEEGQAFIDTAVGVLATPADARKLSISAVPWRLTTPRRRSDCASAIPRRARVFMWSWCAIGYSRA